MTVLDLRELRITLGDRTLVDGVSLTVEAGECLAIVGESGAGKSLTAQALLGLSAPGVRTRTGSLRVAGCEMATASERQWRRVRGADIALVSQDALVSLDPFRRIEAEIAEPLEIHRRDTRADRAQTVRGILPAVGLRDPALLRRYPHELSGGQRQRALIASAVVAGPGILVADEPTTALDATVQATVLDLLRRIADDGTAVVLVSHDLGAVARVADRIVVMRDGRVVETGPAAALLAAPTHPYTRELVSSARAADSRPAAAPVPDRVIDPPLRARGLEKSFGTVRAVDGVDVELHAGRVLAVVGESGSGKTTLARLLLGAETPDAGEVTLDGEAWNPARERVRRTRRTRIQFVHQNPRGALDPRWSIGRSVGEALALAGVARAERPAATRRLLAQVDLAPELAGRRPGALSGGQRQRAAIARALAVDPAVLILDEPVSALDATVRERVLALLDRLRAERGLAMLLISHDLGAVTRIADDVLVMRDGAVVERGPTAQVLHAPRHPFTRELISAAGISPASPGTPP